MKVLSIKNCRLKRNRVKDADGTYLYGFILMAKGKTVEFYSFEQRMQNEWIQALKPSVILLDLKEELNIGRLIGRGNFAKVHVCTRKFDNSTQFALKTMEKQSIRKSKRNIVSGGVLMVLEFDPARDRRTQEHGPPEHHQAVRGLRV